MAKKKHTLKLIDAPAYGYWKALYMSFYSKFLYVDVAKRWRGLGLRYLFLVILLLSIPYSYRVMENYNATLNEQLIDPIKQLPLIYIQQGKVFLDKPMPYFIKNKKNEVVLIIDTTDSIQDFDPRYPKLTTLINKDRISFKYPSPQLFIVGVDKAEPTKPQVTVFGEHTNIVFSGKQIIEDGTFNNIRRAGKYMVYPLTVTTLYSVLIVLYFALALLGQFFARVFFFMSISYRQSSKLLIVSSTPMLLLLIILMTCNAIFNGSGIVLTALLAVYFCFALKSFKSESQSLVS